MKVLHVITGLGSGGAERMMLNVVAALPHCEHEVFSLTHADFYLQELLPTVNRVTFCGSRNPLKIAIEIRSVFKSGDFDVLQSWMFHADFLSSIALGWRARTSVIWGVQAGELPIKQFGRRVVWIRKVLALLSYFLCTRIIVCSANAMDVLSRIGYQPRRMTMIPNSVDTEVFSPSTSITDVNKTSIFIVPARWHPMKNHRLLLTAWRTAVTSGLKGELWLVGSGMDRENIELSELISATNTSDSVVLHGQVEDMPRLYKRADFVCLSSSSGEGLPLALCEALASGLPAVVTNVGDMAKVVSDAGITVPSDDVSALSEALIAMASMDFTERAGLQKEARNQIVSKYSISVAAEQYLNVWTSAARR